MNSTNFTYAYLSGKGFLTKCFKDNCIYKTGIFLKPNFSVIEPVVECICSEILELMNINHASYSLVDVLVEETDLWKAQKTLCCRSPLFTSKNIEFVPAKKYTGGIKDYNRILKSLPNLKESQIGDMIIFDFLVNNTDRHHNNFGILQNIDTGVIEFSPLFDHGSSLLSDFNNDYVENESISDLLLDCDYSKFCDSCNSNQLKRVKEFKCNLDFSERELLLILDKFSKYFSPKRFEAMRELLKSRNKVLNNFRG